MSASAGPQEVADAIGLALERQHSSGAPWCPPNDGETVKRWITDRGAALGSNLRRVVRLARVMQIVEGRDYTHFLYVRLHLLRAREFRTAFTVAARSHSLPKTIATPTPNGIVLHETALRGPEGQAFEIDFALMPRLAALLDVVHNALGFQSVRAILRPLCEPSIPERGATEVARELQSKLIGWLNARLESLTHVRQAQRLWAFLAERGTPQIDAIGNEAILDFWTTVGANREADAVDGFRMFTSAARALLRYRSALRDAVSEASLERTLQGVGQPEGVAQYELDLPRSEASEAYRSPLAALSVAPTDCIKWLTQKEMDQLIYFLGNAVVSDHTSENQGADGQSTLGESGGLFPNERFDLTFCLTLQRAEIFGAMQASIIARIRKRVPGNDAIDQAAATLGVTPYEALAKQYQDIRAQLHLECLAALAILMEAGRGQAAFLLPHLGAVRLFAKLAKDFRVSETEDCLEQRDDGVILEQMGSALKAVLADPSSVEDEEDSSILATARAATRRVNRAGFRKEDRQDPRFLSALSEGAIAVTDIIKELDRLIPALNRADRHTFDEDTATFMRSFQQLYG